MSFRRIVLLSVKHSGSHVMLDGVLDRRKLLRPAGYTVKHIHPQVDGRPLPEHFLAVSTLRHPRRVAESWRRRGKLQAFMRQWQQFMDEYHRHVDHYLHVDDLRIRDRQVFVIGKALGLALKCDWHARYASVHNTISIDLDACPEVPEHFIELYESCKSA